ncbi:hypothetical protein ACIBI9_36715 [Nonomuraea sp. NPDC050451]|uniref:hypothetical protein n=1 Tax=Nonomuraea sp. NPDC050451 TaxID=3364364 RepID=UPI0037B5C69D
MKIAREGRAVVLSVPIRGPQRVQPVFWWWLAAAYALWEIVLPVLVPPRRIMCGGMPIVHRVSPARRAAADVAEVIGDSLYLAGPFLLAMIAVFAARSDGARVPLRVAALGFGLLALPEALVVAEDLLAPPMEPPPGCLPEREPEPAVLRILSIALSWVVSPLTVVLLAGLHVRPDRGSVLRLVAAIVVVVLLVQAVRILPERPVGPPPADDGTPRYAVLGNGMPTTVDLVTGRIAHEYVPHLGTRVAQLQAVAATRRPGEYVAGVRLERGPDEWSTRGFVSRLHRLTVDADGQAKLGEALSGRLTGVVGRVTVSPEGRIAYALSAEGHDNQTQSYAGVLAPHREWPAKAHGLYWRDAHTLALPDDLGTTPLTPGSATGPFQWWEAAIDVRLPPSDPRSTAGRVPAPREAGSHTLPLPLPGGRTLRVRHGSYAERSQLLLYEGERKVATVLTLGCGDIVSLAADPSGRHVLLGKDNENDPTAGNNPCGGASYELLRLSLAPGFNHKVVWRGESSVHELTW